MAHGRRALLALGGAAGAALAASVVAPRPAGLESAAAHPWDLVQAQPAPRAQQLTQLRRGGFDVLVVGGGATGTGVALDAATRGLRVALVEADDFASGTSSRSTKLIHGGVRYLEKAVKQLDCGQLKLVFEALHERSHLLAAAPHLTNALPTVMPCYKWWEVPYFWVGLKAYDLIAGSSGIAWSRFHDALASRARFPTLASHHADGETLKGSIVYFDGQMDDARINVALATTAAIAGAVVANHVRVVDLCKNADGVVCGAVCEDALTGERFQVGAQTVVNATGAFCDALRSRANAAALPLISPSSGVHITLPGHFSPGSHGLIIPKTKDGRVVFLLPWLGSAVAGTTDAPTGLTHLPKPTAAEVDFILDALGDFLTVKPQRADVLSAWSGIRPLAADAGKGSTENITRDHVLTSDAGLVTITGGKWTTYRLMAQDTVDHVVREGRLSHALPCSTSGMRLAGAQGWHEDLPAQVYNSAAALGLREVDGPVASHLAHAYGGRAGEVLKLAAERQGRAGVRLVRDQPFLEAEVAFCARAEFCVTAVDFLARRSRLAFLDTAAARQALPRVVRLLGDELGWSRARRRSELADGERFISTFTIE